MKVKLLDLFFDYGIPWIGVASVMLFGMNFLLGTGDAKTVRAAASFGVLLYIGCVLAKFEHNKEKNMDRA